MNFIVIDTYKWTEEELFYLRDFFRLRFLQDEIRYWIITDQLAIFEEIRHNSLEDKDLEDPISRLILITDMDLLQNYPAVKVALICKESDRAVPIPVNSETKKFVLANVEEDIEQKIKLSEKYLIKKPSYNDTYSSFAQYYDEYMSHVSYEMWVENILDIYNKTCHRSPESILELACGTANVSRLLMKRELKVEASDISEQMLKMAYSKKHTPYLFNANMVDKLESEKYDLILNLFDSINYLNDHSQLTKLFDRIRIGLKAGGVFIFDISTLKNCEDNFDGFVNIEDKKDMYFIHHCELNRKKMVMKTCLTLFQKVKKQYQRKDENHIQRVYLAKDLVELIGKAGLELKAIYSFPVEKNLLKDSIRDLDRKYTRLFFVIKKNEFI